MINYVTKQNIHKHNVNSPKILDYPYRILIIGGFGSGRTKALLNLVKYQDDGYSVFDEMYLYLKDSHEVKHQYPFNKHEKVVLKI